MDPHDRLEAIFSAALAVPAAKREAWLTRECADDDALRARLLNLLRAQSAFLHRRPTAPDASHANGFGVSAVVARQAFRRSMDSQRDRTVRTDGNIAAGAALHEGRKASTIEQQDGLFTSADGVPEGAIERLAEYAAKRVDRNCWTLHSHVDDLDARKGAATHAVG